MKIIYVSKILMLHILNMHVHVHVYDLYKYAKLSIYSLDNERRGNTCMGITSNSGEEVSC